MRAFPVAYFNGFLHTEEGLYTRNVCVSLFAIAIWTSLGRKMLQKSLLNKHTAELRIKTDRKYRHTIGYFRFQKTSQWQECTADPSWKYTEYKRVKKSLFHGIGIENFSTYPWNTVRCRYTAAEEIQ